MGRRQKLKKRENYPRAKISTFTVHDIIRLTCMTGEFSKYWLKRCRLIVADIRTTLRSSLCLMRHFSRPSRKSVCICRSWTSSITMTLYCDRWGSVVICLSNKPAMFLQLIGIYFRALLRSCLVTLVPFDNKQSHKSNTHCL